MKRTIDLSTWPRREYYEFFGNMPDPYWGLAAKVDFTECYRTAKAAGESFFFHSLHRILTALNSVPELRTRIEAGEVVIHGSVGVSPTIAHDDGSFGFGYFEYHENLREFLAGADKEMLRVKGGSGLCLDGNEHRTDLIYYSAIPWVDFLSIKEEGAHRPGDSIPQISTGKLCDIGGRKLMTVSILVNHGLADGRHVGQFYTKLEEI